MKTQYFSTNFLRSIAGLLIKNAYTKPCKCVTQVRDQIPEKVKMAVVLHDSTDGNTLLTSTNMSRGLLIEILTQQIRSLKQDDVNERKGALILPAGW